jgi:hypothetical protein
MVDGDEHMVKDFFLVIFLSLVSGLLVVVWGVGKGLRLLLEGVWSKENLWLDQTYCWCFCLWNVLNRLQMQYKITTTLS